MNRRKFLEKASMSSAAMVSSFYIPASGKEKKLKVGLIGCGWYGMVITKAALKVGGIEIIGVCDVDSANLNNSADEIEKLQGTMPKTYKDYQDLIDMKKLEAIFIATPPHWHAMQFIACCEKGLDVYCEKPLAYDVKEGMSMMEAHKKAGNIVQVGFQRRQNDAFKKVGELIKEGTIGTVHQVDAHIHYVPNLKDTTIQSPPETLDWDAWCGPAPKLDYCPNIGHFAWRLEKEYGNGHLVDWGIHHIDIIRTIMDLDMPVKFNTTGGILELEGKITTPDTLIAKMDFEQFPLIWQHRMWGSGSLDPKFNNGIYFYGTKGTLFASDRRIMIMPAGKKQEQQAHEIKSAQVQENHMKDFLDAVNANDKGIISCTVEDAFKSTATVQLAMVSYYSGSEVIWDEKSMDIMDNQKASGLLARAYRNPYIRP